MALITHELAWLYRPVSRGWLKAESYVDGTVDLAEVSLLNELIDVEIENERRLTDYERNKRGR